MKYQVKVYEVHALIIDVDAENEEHAKEKAGMILMNNEFDDDDVVYDYTMESSEWKVWEA